MKRYIKSTKYTVEYDDERILEAAHLIEDYFMDIDASDMKNITEYGQGKYILAKRLADDINDYLVSQGDGVTNFLIDTYGEVKHAHGIGNNHEYKLIIVTDGPEIICGSISINNDIYGGVVYVYITNLDNQRVGNTYELRPNGALFVNKKQVK